MLSQEVINETVARISLMPFFPSSDPAARAIVTKEIVNMATSDEQVIWLGYRMQQLYPKQWPGIVELRACFCKRFKPADGVEVNSATYFQQDGFPTEAELGPVPGLCLPPTRSERESLEAGTGVPRIGQGSQLQIAAILDGRGEEAARLTNQLNGLNPRRAEEREEIREAERQIAEAKPTLTEEEKARRIREIETALKTA